MTKRSAVVTGGAGEIGRAIGRVLKRDGWRVWLVDVSPCLERAALDDGQHWHHCDIVDIASCARLLAAVDDPAALINCAGIAAVRPILETDPALWRRMLDVNLTAPLLLAQLLVPAMARRGGGAVVNIASVAGLRAGFGRAAYGTSKAGLIHLTRQMAVEFAAFGIRCNCVAPGPVDTELARAYQSAAQVADYLATIPQARFAEPADVAEVVGFLCSHRATHVTGQCIAVDGGWSSAGVGVGEAQKIELPSNPAR